MNHTNKFHRFTAGLLCLIMVLTTMLAVIPLAAFAVEDGNYVYGIYTYSISAIGESSIIDCDEDASGDITIPDMLGDCPVSAIGDSAFRDCSSLTSINIPNSVTSMGSAVFFGCSALTSVTLPSNLESINAFMFFGCSALASITLPNRLKSISYNAFQMCLKLTSINIPDSVTSIAYYAFAYSGLKHITLPNSLKIIDVNAFYRCNELDSIDIPSSVKYINRNVVDENTTMYISGGTMTVELPNPICISGGSIKLIDADNNLIRGNNGRRLVAVRLNLPNNEKPIFVDVTGLYDKNGCEIVYEMDKMTTDIEGKLYIWLSEGNTLKEIVAGGRKYTIEDMDYLTVNGSLDNEYIFSSEQHTIDINVYFTDGTTALTPCGGWQVREASDEYSIEQYKSNSEYNFYVTTYNDYLNPVTAATSGRYSLFFTLPNGYSIKGLYKNEVPTDELEISGFTYNGSFGTTPALYYFNISEDTVINVFVGQDGKETLRPTILESALPDGKAGMEYEYRLNTVYTDGGERPTLEIDGNLPKGISFSLYDKPIVFGLQIVGYDTDYYFRGTPLETGTFEFDIVLSRGKKEIFRKTVTLDISGNVLPLTIDGAIGEVFNFEKDSSWQTYNFVIQNLPEDLTNYIWSIEGTLPEGLVLMYNGTEASILGTPTEVTDEPVSLTVSVRATAANGDVYYGTTDIIISVYVPVDPFVEVGALLNGTDCTVPMEAANTEDDVYVWLNDIWLTEIGGLLDSFGADVDISMLSIVLGEDFTPATAGTASNPGGTDGSVTFTIEIGDDMPFYENLTCTVKATEYNHTHSFSDIYSYNNTHHWYECTDPECDIVSGEAAHNDIDDGNCTTPVVCECGYCSLPAAVSHKFTGEYKYNENSHWHICQNLGCTVTNTVEEHSGGTATYTQRAVCEVCEQPYGTTADDITSPTGLITVGTNAWNKALNTITFGLFFKETQTVTVNADDTESGVMKTEYCLSDIQLDNFTSAIWTEYTESFNINPNNKYVIYVKITDNAGNTVIINSNGIVLDEIVPVLSGIENNKTYCGAVEVTVADEYLDSIKINGSEVEPSNGKFTVSPANGKQIVTATDMAGNSTTYTITVNNGHIWSEGVTKINYKTHAFMCTVCGIIGNASEHTFIGPNGSGQCKDCIYSLSGKIEAPLDELYVYALKGEEKNTNNAIYLPVKESVMVNGVLFKNAVVLEGKPDEKFEIVFGINRQTFLGKYFNKSPQQPYIDMNNSNSNIITKEGSFKNEGVSIGRRSAGIDCGYGEWKGALGISVNFWDVELNKYAAYTITLKDENNTRTITLITVNNVINNEDNFFTQTAHISFNPKSGTTLPEGTKLVVNPYSPTTDDVKKIADAILPGGKLKIVSKMEEVQYDIYSRKNYTLGSISMWDVINLNKNDYLLMHFGPSNVINRSVSYLQISNKKLYSGEYKSGIWQIGKQLEGTLNIQKISEHIVINGVSYIIGYKIGYRAYYEVNILYTNDGKAAGKFTKDKNGNMSDVIFYDDCTPDVLKKPQGLGVLCAEIIKNNTTYNVNTVFSSDISLLNGGDTIQHNGSISIDMNVLNKSNDIQYVAIHIGKNRLDMVEVKVNNDGKVRINFPNGGQSPFIILAISEAKPFELSVHRIEQSEQQGSESPRTGDNSNPWLRVSLLIVSGGALTVLGIKVKKRRKTI